MTDLLVVTDEDGDSAFGPFDRAGVIRFGREMLQEGIDDAMGDDASIDFATWTDDEIWAEILEMGYGIHTLSPLPRRLTPIERRIVDYLDGMTVSDMEEVYGETLAEAFADLQAVDVA